MEQGLQIWDSNGISILDTNTFTGRLLAIISTGGANGSATIPDLATGTPFGVFNAFYTGSNDEGINPNVTFSGTTITWYYNTTPYIYSPITLINGTIIVGVK